MTPDPNAVAREIVAGPAYRQTTAPSSPSLWEQIGRWIGERWDTIVNGIGGAIGRSPRASAVIGVVVILVLAALLVVLLVRLALLASRSAPLAGMPRRVQAREPATALAQRARDAAAAGAFADAVTLLYRAGVRLLGERAILTEDPAATPGEIARAVPAAAPLARGFVVARYAQRPVSSDIWSDADAAYRTLETTERT